MMNVELIIPFKHGVGIADRKSAIQDLTLKKSDIIVNNLLTLQFIFQRRHRNSCQANFFINS